jgi:DnaJ-class molecular chaperone
MNWRNSLTIEQRGLVSKLEAAYVAKRIALRNTMDCLDCAAMESSGIGVYCPCENGQRVKALDAENLLHAVAQDKAEAARIARACSRCAGSGRYGHYGECFRCNGRGVDPKAVKA